MGEANPSVRLSPASPYTGEAGETTHVSLPKIKSTLQSKCAAPRRRMSARRCASGGGLFCLLCKLYVDAAAQHLGVGIGGFSEKVFVVGAHGKQRGIHPCQRPAKALDLVSAQPHGDVHPLLLVVPDAPLDVRNVVVRLDHTAVFDRNRAKYTCIRAISTARAWHKRRVVRIG